MSFNEIAIKLRTVVKRDASMLTGLSSHPWIPGSETWYRAQCINSERATVSEPAILNTDTNLGAFVHNCSHLYESINILIPTNNPLDLKSWC